ncbi:MAG: peptidoglycan synthetase, partial [Bacteroidales bacterium]|nr:peptidoglycan synthetase [Bacteroidales bacterium]
IAFLDFAHSPSKLKATTNAVRERFPNRKIVAAMELHTFSSLNKEFLPQYAHSMDAADEAIVYFNPKEIEHKRLQPIATEDVARAFGKDSLSVYTDTEQMVAHLRSFDYTNAVLLIMTSGNFSGLDLRELAKSLINK